MTLLDRPSLLPDPPDLRGARVLVTGSSGYIGRRVCATLERLGADATRLDLPADVLDPAQAEHAATRADWCVHLAAHKHAPAGEDHPMRVADVNVRGTENVVRAFGDRVVLASTCKAADPATVYGASKLIAERIVLNAGGRVVRLVNVLGSSGSVVDLWRQTPPDRPLLVTDGLRMWMTGDEAVNLLLAAIGFPSGRYALDVPDATPVSDVAKRLFPDRELAMVPSRRGDRIRERLIGEAEARLPCPAAGAISIVHEADAARDAAPFAPALVA